MCIRKISVIFKLAAYSVEISRKRGERDREGEEGRERWIEEAKNTCIRKISVLIYLAGYLAEMSRKRMALFSLFIISRAWGSNNTVTKLS